MKKDAQGARKKGYQYLSQGNEKIKRVQEIIRSLQGKPPREAQQKQIKFLYESAGDEFKKAFPELVKALLGGQNPGDHELLLDVAFSGCQSG